jgi:hypothetical protein
MNTKIILNLTLVLFLSLSLVSSVKAQKILLETGFEEFTLNKPPKDWESTGGGFEVTDDMAKTEAKSLGVFGGQGDQYLGFPVETGESIISVEFWVYIESGGRSLTISITANEDINANQGGPYINWDAGGVRYYVEADGAWSDLGKFETDTWRYVRVVANFQDGKFDFYSGATLEETLKAKPAKGLKFRTLVGVPCKRIVFTTYALAAPGYVDDLLVYEGAEPIRRAALEPIDKIVTVWGKLKARN